MSEQIWLGTLCAQCGYDVPVDEDGCCATCGADAIGEGADEAIGYRAECYQLRADNAVLLEELGRTTATADLRQEVAHLEAEKEQLRARAERAEVRYHTDVDGAIADKLKADESCEQLRAENAQAHERRIAWEEKAATHAKVVQEFRESCEAKGAENARLREWNREQAAENDDLSNAAHEVRAENARLCEAVKTLSYVACAECGCAKCDEGEELDYCECST